jgi:sterol desaturase/sphingolipid hydroxylase (fatty acid hydroxylase superfamily)
MAISIGFAGIHLSALLAGTGVRALRIAANEACTAAHHSIEDDETNSLFGFNLSWWDRLFGTYRDQPRAGQLGMTVGIRDHQEVREVARLDGMLLLP